jgi:hypothetical protein
MRTNGATSGRSGCLLVAKAYERKMAEWRPLYPKDVEIELTLWERKAEGRTMRTARAENRWRKAFIEAQLAGPSTLGDDDDGWEELFLTSEESIEESIEESSGDNFEEWSRRRQYLLVDVLNYVFYQTIFLLSNY